MNETSPVPTAHACWRCRSDVSSGQIVVFTAGVYAHRGACADAVATGALSGEAVGWATSNVDLARALKYLRERCTEELLAIGSSPGVVLVSEPVMRVSEALQDMAKELPGGPMSTEQVHYMREALESLAEGLVAGATPLRPAAPGSVRVPPRTDAGVVDGGES